MFDDFTDDEIHTFVDWRDLYVFLVVTVSVDYEDLPVLEFKDGDVHILQMVSTSRLPIL